ncbi:hypothetical protein NUW54_g11307 [Trametes sanguinea]|uniref:Uncharacterized protein n=1 Tax=Trametes sanguinea TaxID=158606 RepID=A0ACC1NGV4_9APHY|nr:hypothetical protein NUW54_g11307 [Trametes sanguinea]
MVLQFVYPAVNAVIPSKYWPHTLVAATVLAVIYAYAQGRQTTRERDLHARVILLTVSPARTNLSRNVDTEPCDCTAVWHSAAAGLVVGG